MVRWTVPSMATNGTLAGRTGQVAAWSDRENLQGVGWIEHSIYVTYILPEGNQTLGNEEFLIGEVGSECQASIWEGQGHGCARMVICGYHFKWKFKGKKINSTFKTNTNEFLNGYVDSFSMIP